jgi:hypothetical protein
VDSTVETLVVELLEWIGPSPRSYAEVQEAWRTSCPKLPVWEDATDARYVRSWHEPVQGRLIAVTPSGVALLRSRGRGQSFAAEPALHS